MPQTAEILIYEDIGDSFDGITAADFLRDLRATPPHDELVVRINSVGGNVFEGMAIFNALLRHKKPVSVVVDGVAASIAALVAQAAAPGRLQMANGALMMIHSPWSVTLGSAAEHRKAADTLEKAEGVIIDALVARSRQPRTTVAAWLDDETWFTADEAIAAGLADDKTPVLAVAAHLSRPWIHHPPEPPRAMTARRRLDDALKKPA